MKLKPDTRRYSQSARAQSAEATARRIVDAFLAQLMEQWFDEITLDRVAADAGVTVQTVVRRFGGKEGLLAGAVKTMAPQVSARRATPPGDLGLLVDNLIEDYEQTGDMVIRLLALEPRFPPLKKLLDFGRGEHRHWVASAFTGPLSSLDAAARRRAIDALIIITDVYSWKLLRRDMGRSVAAAARTMKTLIGVVIAEFAKSDSSGDKR
jgi:AcrR family transcriptional regulator